MFKGKDLARDAHPRENMRVRRETRGNPCGRKREGGFSLLELIIVLSILLVVAGIFVPNISRVMQDMPVANGYDTTLMTIRRAREAAVAERRVYVVTLTAPNTISIAPLTADPLAINVTATLPVGVAYSAEAGIPNTLATTPDHLGSGAATGAIYFDVGVNPAGTNTIYFYPDGSSRDINGNTNSGVVYIARPGQVMSSRAVTVWGASGRIRGWRLSGSPVAPVWRQQ